MKPTLRYLLYGIGVWLAPFALGTSLFAAIDQSGALFDTIMSIAVGATAGWLSYLFLRGLKQAGAAVGALAGAGWAGLGIALDSPLFLFGPFTMATPDYFADIGLTYAMIPIIAAAVGAALHHVSAAVASDGARP